VVLTRVVRVSIWVRPGSARPGVGGERAGALVVRVSARAVDGKATEAALAALAAAFGVPCGAVRLVAGASNRAKIADVDGGDPAVLDRLLGASLLVRGDHRLTPPAHPPGSPRRLTPPAHPAEVEVGAHSAPLA